MSGRANARLRRALPPLLTVFALLALAPAASAFIYWADTQNQRIGRANNDGSGLNPNFIVGTGSVPAAVAIDSAHVYWANQNGSSIGRANIDGTGVDNGFLTGISTPSGVAVSSSYVYWSTTGGQVGRANLNGTSKNPTFITGVTQPCGLAVDSGHLYWVDIANTNPALIGRAGLDGSNKQLEYVKIPGVSFPCGVAVNASNIFWSDIGFLGGGTRIGRANTNTGEGADASIIGDGHAPCGVAVDSAHLYWANLESNTIGRANTDATGVNQSFIATGGNQICGVAVDDGFAPPASSAAGVQPTPSAPADTTPPQTTVAKGPGKALAKGIAKFRFRSSEGGSTFACKLDKRKARSCKSPKTYRHLKPGKHKFKVWATDAAGNKDPTPAKRTFRVPAPAA